MSISSEIERIQTAKSDIITAIENKGVTVPTGATIDGLPALIDSIPSGGGGGDDTLLVNTTIYHTVKLGNLIWLSENFCEKVGTYVYEGSFQSIYYGTDDDTQNAITAICPDGWRIPTKNDFQYLIDNFGNNPNDYLAAFIRNNTPGQNNFNAFLYGNRVGSVYGYGSNTLFMSTTKSDSTHKYNLYISKSDNYMYIANELFANNRMWSCRLCKDV